MAQLPSATRRQASGQAGLRKSGNVRNFSTPAIAEGWGRGEGDAGSFPSGRQPRSARRRNSGSSAHLQFVSSGLPACCSCHRARHLGCTLRGQLQGLRSISLSAPLSSRQIQHTSSLSCGVWGQRGCCAWRGRQVRGRGVRAPRGAAPSAATPAPSLAAPALRRAGHAAGAGCWGGARARPSEKAPGLRQRQRGRRHAPSESSHTEGEGRGITRPFRLTTSMGDGESGSSSAAAPRSSSGDILGAQPTGFVGLQGAGSETKGEREEEEKKAVLLGPGDGDSRPCGLCAGGWRGAEGRNVGGVVVCEKRWARRAAWEAAWPPPHTNPLRPSSPPFPRANYNEGGRGGWPRRGAASLAAAVAASPASRESGDGSIMRVKRLGAGHMQPRLVHFGPPAPAGSVTTGQC